MDMTEESLNVEPWSEEAVS